MSDAKHPLTTTVSLADRMWSALLHRCAAHKPQDHHKVYRIVMVTREDINAVAQAVEAS